MHLPILPQRLMATACQYLNRFGRIVESEKWQGLDMNRPMLEFQHFYFMMPMVAIADLETIPEFKTYLSMPWARQHLKERLSSIPLNPGETYKIWPYYGQDKAMRTENQKFSHTYMERYWPKKAWDAENRPPNGQHFGIRYPYGDLADVIHQLHHNIYTRQAYLPVWFPEDTGAVHGGRVPCSIGYHFLYRNGKMDCTYHIRSCDIFRHFIDDVYLTVGLTDFVVEKLNDLFGGSTIQLGNLYMNIGSLHCFNNEKNRLIKYANT